MSVYFQRAFFFATMLSTAFQTAVAQSSPAPPNMLIILADDLGYADLQCCGSTDMQTPHLDELFRAGMKFTNAYANCPVCSPTRAALLSGRYQDVVGVPGVIRTHPENSWGYLDPQVELLPSVARKSGYRTAIVGKWHLGLDSPNTPTERGFDVFRGFLGDMMDDYYHHRRHDVNYMRIGETVIDPEGHATDLFSDWAVEFLNEHADARNPFLLYLAYNAPHTPIQPPDTWLQKVQQREPGIAPARAKLVALIEHMDDGIGKVIAALKRNQQWDNTIIVFTSDNGGQLDAGANNGLLRDGKQSVYEGGLKVPMCVVWPNHVQPETETSFAAMSMDILPTLFQAASIAVPEDLDGRSFLPTILGDTQPPLRTQWLFTRREGGLNYGGKTIEAIRDGDWKLLQNSPFGPLELYNLSTDFAEKTDVAKQNRAVVNRLNSALRLHLQRGGAVPWQPPMQE